MWNRHEKNSKRCAIGIYIQLQECHKQKFPFFSKEKKSDTQYQAMVTFDSLFQNELQQSVNASMKIEYILSFYPNGTLYVA